MLRALGITRNRPDSLTHEERTNRIVQQALEFENALKAMDYVLDDRSSEGIHLIANHNEVAISKLAYGVIQFLEATLGFEPETMKRANNTLIAASDMCWKEKVKAEGLKLQTSAIYPPGTEWAVTYAESNLLSALLMLLSESVVESAKALLKLRRAYHSLDEISKKMEKYNSDINLAAKNKSSSIISIGVRQPKQSNNDIDITSNNDKPPSIQINRSHSSNNISSAASLARSANPNGSSSINNNNNNNNNVNNTPRSDGANGGTLSPGYTSDRSRSGSVSSSNSSNFQDAKSASLKRDSSNASLNSLDTSSTSSAFTSLSLFSDIPIQLTDQQRKDTDMLKKLEKIYQMRKERIYGEHIGNPPVKDSLRTELGYKEPTTITVNDEAEIGHESMEIDIDKLSKKFDNLIFNIGDPDISTIDEFIHSGVNLCFGILQVVLSLIPPAIGKVLSVVGFKGSREVGLQMVWKAAAERNIHGGIGLLFLLVFYDGPFQFTDVDFDIPSTEELEKVKNKISRTTSIGSTKSAKSSKSSKSHLSKKLTITSVTSGNNSEINDGSDLKKTITRQKMQMESNAVIGAGEPTVLHPGPKLVAALLHSRAMFPNSALWLLQESRMLASRGRLEEAIDLMDTAERSEMKQVDALLIFDKAMVLVFLHKYERAAKELLFLVELNAWSHSLYTFFAGVCYAESYRMCKMGLTIEGGVDNVDPSKMDWYKQRAEECITEAPTLVGKKKFLSKPMPFERFVLRKYDNLMKTKEETGLDLIDCINCSIAHELAYFWNGYNRMPEEHLKLSIKLLGYSANPDCKYATLNPETGKSYSKIKETREESFLRYTLTSISLRRLGLIDEGIKMIDDKVIKYLFEHNKIDSSNRFNKLTENPWVYPTSCYERSLFTWKSQGVDGLDEAKVWLKRALVIGGDDYELSTRVGMKIKAALDRLEGL